MNNFTKSELQEIADSLSRDPFGAKSVTIKIQSMIDNYCEHTPQHEHIEKFPMECETYVCGNSYEKCSKCGDLAMNDLTNDLTKEDLEIMADIIVWVELKLSELKFGSLSARGKVVKNKIQFMIDNYCEHEFDMTEWVNDSSGCRWYECKKCEGRYR